MTARRHEAAAFGLRWRSHIPLPGFDPVEGGHLPTIDVIRTAQLPERTDGCELGRGTLYSDGIRFTWGSEAVFDMVDGTHIAYAPGPGWAGMPVSFYGTVAALTAAWRGLVPLHACAVEVDGRAVLIAGAAEAGKSTMTAGLVAAGARFVADDLTVVSIGGRGPGSACPRVAPGRPTMRIHAGTAALLDATEAAPVVGDPRGKWLVRPRLRGMADSLDLGAVLLLEEGAAGVHADPIALFAHLFRPRWIRALPMRTTLMADLLAIAARVPILTYPAAADFTIDTWRSRANEALAIVRAAFRRS